MTPSTVALILAFVFMLVAAFTGASSFDGRISFYYLSLAFVILWAMLPLVGVK